MTTELQSFSWGDIALSEVVHLDGIPHVTKRAIGEWLEYSDPRGAVNTIVDRNRYIEQWSTGVNLPSVDGKNRDTSVYHPVGFLLIVMESGQPKAMAMKVAVAEFVWSFCGRKTLSTADRIGLRRELRLLLKEIDRSQTQFTRDALFQAITEISQDLGVKMPDKALIMERLDGQQQFPGMD